MMKQILIWNNVTGRTERQKKEGRRQVKKKGEK